VFDPDEIGTFSKTTTADFARGAHKHMGKHVVRFSVKTIIPSRMLFFSGCITQEMALASLDDIWDVSTFEAPFLAFRK
jgi:hypothetical protein